MEAGACEEFDQNGDISQATMAQIPENCFQSCSMQLLSGCTADCNECQALFVGSGACAEMQTENGVSQETMESIPFSCYGSCGEQLFSACSDSNQGSVGKEY